MSDYNCDDCELDCSVVVNSLCRKGLIDDCKQLQAKNNDLKELIDDTVKRLKHSTCPHAKAALMWIDEALKEPK